MRSTKHGQPSVLPKYFPVGTVYVVEGRAGENGRLRVSSRYLVMPGAGRIDLASRSDRAAQSDRVRSVRVHGHGPLGSSGARRARVAGTGRKKSAGEAKKFVVVAGTAA
jgi:hypothetical protein